MKIIVVEEIVLEVTEEVEVDEFDAPEIVEEIEVLGGMAMEI